MMPVFSVLTPVYNGAAFLRRCHATLAAQSFQDWEWVVVDDGSTDETAELVRGICDERIKLVSYRPNMGRGHARHAALEAARGEWMVVWDADDMYFPDRLAQIDKARRADFDFFCSYALVVDNNLHVKGVRGFHPAARGLPRHFVHATLGCRMEIARRVGYDPAFRVGEDATITWVLDEHYRGLFFDDALMIYQEERELSAAKALATCQAQVVQLKRARQVGLLALSAEDYGHVIGVLRFKSVLLRLMTVVPPLYRLTISRRSYGQVRAGYALPAWRQEYLAALRREWVTA